MKRFFRCHRLLSSLSNRSARFWYQLKALSVQIRIGCIIIWISSSLAFISGHLFPETNHFEGLIFSIHFLQWTLFWELATANEDVINFKLY